MTELAHVSVLAAETIELLAPQNNKVYVDGTLGRAGHSALILEAAPGARLIGIDRDPAALDAARDKLAQYGDRVTLVHAAFADISQVLADLAIPKVDGILLDLGVSSPQLDDAERGFSFARPGPLDMRMDPTRGRTARELLVELDQDELGQVIAELGEERYARKMARMIKDKLRGNPDAFATTTELAVIATVAIPMFEQRKSKIHPATRMFQGLRIAVNAELEQLKRILFEFPNLLNVGGRCAVISFHSLEDRLVKNRFRDLAWSSSLPPAFAEREGERTEAVCELITRKSVTATEDEIARNPRSRSAHLRVCERTGAPNVPATAAGLSPVGRSHYDKKR